MREFDGVGKFLYEKRKQAGLSQKELSSYLGYGTSQYISNYERGLCPPPMAKLKEIVKLLGINPYEMIDVMQDARKAYLMNTLSVEKTTKKKKAR